MSVYSQPPVNLATGMSVMCVTIDLLSGRMRGGETALRTEGEAALRVVFAEILTRIMSNIL